MLTSFAKQCTSGNMYLRSDLSMISHRLNPFPNMRAAAIDIKLQDIVTIVPFS